MNFPITVAGRTFDAAPAVAQAVLDDAMAGGGTLVAGQRPATWLADAVNDGVIDRSFVIGLCAALVRAGHPVGLLEAIDLAVDLGLSELVALLPAALDGLDMGILLHADPRGGDGSVEDALLRGWAALVSAEQPEGRDALLLRLRHAGLRSLELDVLARTGDAAAVRAVLPLILAEELPVADVSTLAAALVRGPDVADAVCRAAGGLTASQRYAVWHAAVGIRPALEADDALRARWLTTDAQAEGAAN
jgi:hypothetical protein